ncbi:MAG: hypothetical protein H7281_13190 [Bacteriovorax sp.]|nr:hypothetical protein [Bacteriovorax sp.]
MNIIFLIALFFLSAIQAQIIKPVILDPQSRKHLILSCSIYNMNGKRLRRYPGSICVFEENGNLLLSNNQKNELSFFDPNMRILWKIPMHIHHQINKTSDGDFLILSSESKIYRNKKIRFDRLIKINLKGEIVASFKFYDHKKAILKNINKRKLPLFKFGWDKDNQYLGEAETSHSNSFYEIPVNDKSQLFPELQAGNFIVNPNNNGWIMILDHSLTHILKFIKPPADRIHDVQITEKGEILLYNNQVHYTQQIYSELQIYSYPDQNIIWNYHRNSSDFNYPDVGGVQLLGNDELLFSDIHIDSFKAILLNYKTKKELKVIIPEGYERLGAQQVKMQNLNSFLKLNKGP